VILSQLMVQKGHLVQAPVDLVNRLGDDVLEGTYIVHSSIILESALRDEVRIISSGKSASSFDLLSKMAMGSRYGYAACYH